MDTVNVVVVTSDARPITSQFASWQEAADAVVQWSKNRRGTCGQSRPASSADWDRHHVECWP